MTTIWFDGELKPLDEAQPSILSHTLHYGVGVFEGIRSYAGKTDEGGVFRLEDHIRRLEASAKACGLSLPHSQDELVAACLEVLAANEMVDAYLRPVAYQDDGTLGGLGSSPPVHVAIIANKWGAYLGEEGLAKGIHCTVSSWRRSGHGSFLSRAKVNGQYVASVLAKRQAVASGFDEALLCDDHGHVCEGTGENLFMVRDGVLRTPPDHASILPGITRHSVLHLAHELGERAGVRGVEEAPLTRDALLLADEVFLTGTAAEVTPVRMIDRTPIGCGARGPVTEALQSAFFELVRGAAPAPAGWRTTFAVAVR
jgi:branched-chain amino acid aminotransferase